MRLRESAYLLLNLCWNIADCTSNRFKGMSVDDFLGGGFMQGASDDEGEEVSVGLCESEEVC